ncbi:MAG: hypothetical protein JAZ13_07695 [Candidatus Thiodiazotropha taylori]|nr:hypothetical protein [Candidatus Thiodiazotropha taylori]
MYMRVPMYKFFAVFIILLPGFVVAAEVSLVLDNYRYPRKTPVVSIVGKIVEGDLVKVENVAKEIILKKGSKFLHVYLNSSGGDANEAMKIGRLLRKLLAKTYAVGFTYYDPKSQHGLETAQYYANNPEQLQRTPNNIKFIPLGEKVPEEYIRRCYSACVLIFYAGVRKDASNNGYFRDSSNIIPVIGLHRPYFDKNYYSELSPIEANSKYKDLEKSIATYLSEMGAPDEIIERMLKTPSNDIELVDHREFENLYERKEPFFDEWLLAKCGEMSNGKAILNDEDYAYIEKIRREKMSEARRVGDGSEAYTSAMLSMFVHVEGSFFPKGSDLERYKRLLNIVRQHNLRIRDCQDGSVQLHQIQWALSH